MSSLGINGHPPRHRLDPRSTFAAVPRRSGGESAAFWLVVVVALERFRTLFDHER